MSHPRLKIVTYKETLDLHKENYPDMCFSMRVNFRIEKYLPGLTKHQHFGNPFVADKKGKNGYGTVEEVSKLYVKWLKGEVYQNTEPNRREWIMKQICNGSLDNRVFLYYRDCSKVTSHTLELLKFIDSEKQDSLF